MIKFFAAQIGLHFYFYEIISPYYTFRFARRNWRVWFFRRAFVSIRRRARAAGARHADAIYSRRAFN